MTSNTHDPYNLADLKTEYWPIDKVFPYAKNTKVHSKAHIDKLKASIKADGLYDALIVDRQGVLIAGHGRFEAMKALKHLTVPVKWAKELTENQADAARISHNKTASTDYDSGFMAEELQRLSETGEIDLETLGFDDHELQFLVEDLGEMNVDGLSDDLDGDIDRQDAETEEKVTATDAGEESLSKILGFKSVPIASAKSVRRLIADLEEKTGLLGQQAFVKWCDSRESTSL
jgi:hypothetical protein